MTKAEQFMQRALDLARMGSGYTSPNPMVGAVVVKDGRVVGEGYHQACGQAHAEVNALNQAGEKAVGADLYVTLEPCNHTGKIPPCTQKILESGIAHVIMAMADPNPDVTGGGEAFLVSRGIRVTRGILESEALRLNEAFIKHKMTGKPFVTLKMAATMDGRTGTRSRDSRWISGSESRRIVHRMRHEMDAVLIGSGTVQADNPLLTARCGQSPDGRPPKNPIRIVLDSRLSIPDTAHVLAGSSNLSSETFIVTGSGHHQEQKNRLIRPGVRIVESETNSDGIDLAKLMPKLGAMGVGSILIEGGSRVAGSALRSGIVDKIVFFFAPKLTGGDDGIPICSGPGPEFMSECIPLKHLNVEKSGEDVMITGYTG